MPAIVLVRHALPRVERGLAARLWGLSGAAREDCVLLAECLPQDLGPTIFTSGERKALETARILALRAGREVAVDAGFAEADRPQVWDEEYRALAGQYAAGEPLPGWEPAATVHARFAAAVERARAHHPPDVLAVVSHGLALTLYLARFRPTVLARGSVRPFDAAEFWSGLSFPDAWRFEPRTNTVTRLFAGGLPPPGS